MKILFAMSISAPYALFLVTNSGGKPGFSSSSVITYRMRMDS